MRTRQSRPRKHRIPVTARKRVRAGRRPTNAPRIARSTCAPAAPDPRSVIEIWRAVLLALLDLSESQVLEFPEERAMVIDVRSHALMRFAGRKAPPCDPRSIAFTLGLIATLVDSDFGEDSLATYCTQLLAPESLAAFERAKGYVACVSPSRWTVVERPRPAPPPL